VKIDGGSQDWVSRDDPSQFYIHTVRISQKPGKSKRRRLLLIPGYAASGVCYFSLFAKLREEFEVTLFDVLGFGCSGRPEVQDFTVDGLQDFFNW